MMRVTTKAVETVELGDEILILKPNTFFGKETYGEVRMVNEIRKTITSDGEVVELVPNQGPSLAVEYPAGTQVNVLVPE